MKAFSALLIASMAVAPSLIAEQPVVAQEQVRDSLSGFRFTTKRRVVVMPVQDKSGGQAGGLTDFAGEVLNQTLRNGGVKTVAWFKVQRKLKEMMSGGVSDARKRGWSRSILTSTSRCSATREVLASKSIACNERESRNLRRGRQSGV